MSDEDIGRHGDPDVIFATPTVSHGFVAHWVRSMQETQWLLSAHGITSGVMVRPGDCFVDKARNKLVTDFLVQFKTTQDFFFLDDDIGWEPMKVLEFLQRPDDILAGVYPKKSETMDWPCSFAVDDNGALCESEGLILAMMAPTGFLRIRRHVLEKLAATSTTFLDTEIDGKRKEYHYIFETGRGSDGQYWGEDYTFCQKVRGLGFNIWVDPNITFKHQGVKTWEDRLSGHVDVFRERAKLLKDGKLDPETLQPIPEAA